jgi:hypothetical protein
LQFPILQQEIQEFIKANAEVSIHQLALQKNPFPVFNWKKIVEQIECRQKSKDKLPTWFKTESIIYPSKISIEQTSSEKTAAYKASLISGNSIIDLTGGFGVDAYYFSKSFQSVVHCELNEELSTIVAHNVKQLHSNSIACYSGDSYEILSNLNRKFDWIYIDPSRRNDHKGKVFMLKDCLPNVPDLLDFYFNYSDNLLIKTAPLLDIAAGLNEMKKVKKIHIVAIENEVKELLWEISKNETSPVEICTVNLKKEHTEYFQFEWNKNSDSIGYSLPQKYLYEPNSAIMKSGGFNEVSLQFNIDKLHPNSHLYTSNQLIPFSGRTFEINAVLPYQKKEMKAFLEGNKANITTRNFSDSVDEIRKKWKIKEGGNLYCFFTTDANNTKIVLLCTKF